MTFHLEGLRRFIQGRIGVKIGILAVALGIPALVVKMISFILVFPFARSWPVVAYILFAFSMLVVYGIMALLIVISLAKPEIEEKLYENPGSGVVVGLMLCFPIAMTIILGEYYLEDSFTTAFIFLCGILFIISGIVMAHEVKAGVEQDVSETRNQEFLRTS